jgi:hypothetical protein
VYRGGEAAPEQMEIERRSAKMFFFGVCLFGKHQKGLSSAKLAVPLQPRCSTDHSQHRLCNSLSVQSQFNLNSIHFSFLSTLSVSTFVASFNYEFVAVQSPLLSSLALETSYENESIIYAPIGPLPRCQYSYPYPIFP